MDTSATIDSFIGSPTMLPEISFADMVDDDSPVKKSINDDLMDDYDPLELDHEKDSQDNDTLNTPKPKKSYKSGDSSSNAKITTVPSPIKSTVTATSALKPVTTAPVLLNSKNILPKTALSSLSTTVTTSTSQQIIKISPKLSPALVAAGKTAVKTANGQILYLQKAPADSNKVTANRIATSVSGSTGITGTGTTTVIQVIRAGDGSLVPVKTTSTASAASASSPSGALNSAGKKIISTSAGQVVWKAPLKTLAATAATAKTSSSTSVSVTGTAAVTSSVKSTNAGVSAPLTTQAKIVVQSTNGKQIIVSNPQLIKLASKTLPATFSTSATNATTSATTTTGPSTSTGKIQAIQIPGKGLQYVCVLPNSKFPTGPTSTASAGNITTSTTTKILPITSATANSSNTGKTNSSTTAIAKSTATATVITSTTLSSTNASSSVKILNPVTQKFKIINSSNANATVTGKKIVFTQSPKKDGTLPVTFSPLTGKVHKAVVTLPSLRPINNSGNGEDGASKKNPSTIVKTSTAAVSGSMTTLFKNGSNAIINSTGLGKNKISEINSEIQRMASGENGSSSSEVKKSVNASRYILATRSTRPGGATELTTLHVRPTTVMQRVVMHGPTGAAYKTVSADGSHSAKKLYNVLKSSSDDGKKSTDLKPLIICGVQARELFAKQHLQSMQQKKAQIFKRQFLQQQKQLRAREVEVNMKRVASASQSNSTPKFVTFKIKQEPEDSNDASRLKLTVLSEEPANVVRRKHCNCSKSQCLKLYCDCFANGEFCQDCTCKDCFNNLDHEDERQRAIRNCLERNPSAFKPKITTSRDQSDMRLHNKGCNCKRSGCLKNYCECYEAKIPCSSNCKCVGCRNVEDRPDLDMDPIDPKLMAALANGNAPPTAAPGGAIALAAQKRTYDKMSSNTKPNNDKQKDAAKTGCELMPVGNGGQPPEKQQCNFITQDVIDATIQCMISQADECEKNGLPAYQTEKMVMEELGRCLVEIIDFSIRNTDSSFTQD